MASDCIWGKKSFALEKYFQCSDAHELKLGLLFYNELKSTVIVAASSEKSPGGNRRVSAVPVVTPLRR